jgi:hypothetical protein
MPRNAPICAGDRGSRRRSEFNMPRRRQSIRGTCPADPRDVGQRQYDVLSSGQAAGCAPSGSRYRRRSRVDLEFGKMRRSRPRIHVEVGSRFDRFHVPIEHAQLRVIRFQPALSWRAAASAVSAGWVLNVIAAPGAALWTAFTTISNSGRLVGGSLRPPPITTQS